MTVAYVLLWVALLSVSASAWSLNEAIGTLLDKTYDRTIAWQKWAVGLLVLGVLCAIASLVVKMS